MSNAYPEEVHGVEIGEFIISLGVLLENPSIQNKGKASYLSSQIISSMGERNLTTRGCEDVYVAIIIGASYIYNTFFSRENKRKHVTSGSLLKNTLKGSSRRNLSVPLKSDSALHQSESSRIAKKIFGNGAMPIVFHDLELVSKALSEGSSELPIISIKQAPKRITEQDYKALLRSLINIFGFYGEGK